MSAEKKIYRVRQPDGSVVLTDVPPPSAVIEETRTVGPDGEIANVDGRAKTLEVSAQIQKEIDAATAEIEEDCKDENAAAEKRVEDAKAKRAAAQQRYEAAREAADQAQTQVTNAINDINTGLLNKDFAHDIGGLGLSVGSFFAGPLGWAGRALLAGAGLTNDLARSGGLSGADVANNARAGLELGADLGPGLGLASNAAGGAAAIFSAVTSEAGLFNYASNPEEIRGLLDALGEDYDAGWFADTFDVDPETLKAKAEDALAAYEDLEKAEAERDAAQEELLDAIAAAGGEYRECVVEATQAATENILVAHGRHGG